MKGEGDARVWVCGYALQHVTSGALHPHSHPSPSPHTPHLSVISLSVMITPNCKTTKVKPHPAITTTSCCGHQERARLASQLSSHIRNTPARPTALDATAVRGEEECGSKEGGKLAGLGAGGMGLFCVCVGGGGVVHSNPHMKHCPFGGWGLAINANGGWGVQGRHSGEWGGGRKASGRGEMEWGVARMLGTAVQDALETAHFGGGEEGSHSCERWVGANWDWGWGCNPLVSRAFVLATLTSRHPTPHHATSLHIMPNSPQHAPHPPTPLQPTPLPVLRSFSLVWAGIFTPHPPTHTHTHLPCHELAPATSHGHACHLDITSTHAASRHLTPQHAQLAPTCTSPNTTHIHTHTHTQTHCLCAMSSLCSSTHTHTHTHTRTHTHMPPGPDRRGRAGGAAAAQHAAGAAHTRQRHRLPVAQHVEPGAGGARGGGRLPLRARRPGHTARLQAAAGQLMGSC